MTEETKEQTPPETPQEQPEEPKTTGNKLLEEVREERQKLDKVREDLKKENDRLEQLKSDEILSSTGGIRPEIKTKTEAETNKDYANKLLQKPGEVAGIKQEKPPE